MVRRYGEAETVHFDAAQRAAVDLVADLLADHGIDADTHSRGETILAHSPRALRGLEEAAEAIAKAGGTLDFLEQDALRDAGLAGPEFQGALTHPAGFALNPRKYLFGLVRAAQSLGVAFYQNSPVEQITRRADGFGLRVGAAALKADQVIIATNGYSSEDLPGWMAGRYMPAQSTVLVTRPLSDRELQDQGWWSDQMAYDTRGLLHYFRLMPDRRFLFGMRGGLRSSAGAEQAARARTRRDFERMFPAWRGVETTHSWSGFVCLTRDLVPFVAEIPDQPGLLAGFGYHGNGVAMGTLGGKALADLASGEVADLPAFMQGDRKRFPLAPMRRAIMPVVYAGLNIADRF
jgi:glycine/D-amino acid oxidase-like deaminating enzyme